MKHKCNCRRVPKAAHEKFHPRRRCRLAVPKVRVTYRSHRERGEAA